ncbi:MAG: glycosyltransferase [Balneolaceae bacterium]|nr:MAG: glycosyltransferase [Balneolaceae bacterium]
MPRISLIIRTQNEERWIASCLNKIAEQTIQDLEVILVDNRSSDKTVQRALQVMPDLTLVEVDEYLPGKALNEGIRVSSGEFIVCLSSHCIPRDNHWLERLLVNFQGNPDLAGVYGRQIPMHFTNSHDKRDLIVTFGLDKRVQYKDPFFHNANSMIPRTVWEKYPFDEEITNIEDRIWAKMVLSEGYHIVYEPEAAVFHHHGIYQNRNEERLRNVIRIIGEDFEEIFNSKENPFHQEKLNIAAIIPVREEPALDLEIQKRLLEITLNHAKSAPSVNSVFVTTGSSTLAAHAKACGAEVPFLRPDELSGEKASVLEVLQNFLEKMEEKGTFFDYLATLEITHPFRPDSILQRTVEYALNTGLESVVAGMPEYRPSWWLDDQEYQRVDNYLKKRSEREPIHVGLPAICSVITPALLRNGQRIGERTGIVEVTDPLAQIEIRSDSDFFALKRLNAFLTL